MTIIGYIGYNLDTGETLFVAKPTEVKSLRKVWKDLGAKVRLRPVTSDYKFLSKWV